MVPRFITFSLAVVSAAAGKCTDDMSTAWLDNPDFSVAIQTCAVDHNGDGSRVTTCMKVAFPILSNDCASCFGDTVNCGKFRCMDECLVDSFAQECLDCTESKGCNSELSACTGIAQNPPIPTASDLTTRDASVAATVSGAVFAIMALTYL